MALSVISCNILNNAIDIPIDKVIEITFNQEVDRYTIEQGINIYTDSGLGNNSLDIGIEFSYYDFTYELLGNRVVITTTKPLLKNKKHYISIFPGNDASRFISSLTTSAPIYTRLDSSTGTLTIKSAYTGKENATYNIVFIDTNKVSVSDSNGFIGEFLTNVPEVNFGALSVSFIGAFDIADSIDIDCFKADGLDNILEIKFITSQYNTVLPLSEPLDQTLDYIPLQIVSISPENLSINNQRCNPIIIKFNKNLDPNQDFSNKIKIKKKNYVSNSNGYVKYIPQIQNNILKLYLTELE